MELRVSTNKRQKIRAVGKPRSAPEQVSPQLLSELRILADGSQALEAVIRSASRLHSATRVAIYQRDNERWKFHCVASQGLSTHFLETTDGEEAIRIVWNRLLETPTLIEDVRLDPRTAQMREALLAEEIKSFLSVPFYYDGELEGALVLYASRPHRWTRRQLLLSTSLAGQVANITENWRLMTTVQAACAVKESFLSRASHELRTPLTSILAYTQYLERHLASRAGVDFEMKHLQVIETQAMQLARLVQDILDVKEIDGGTFNLKKEPFDLPELIREAVSDVKPIVGERVIEVQTPDECPLIEGDRGRLKQVIARLVSNAIKYSPNGEEVIVRLQHANGYALVSVKDHGIGIQDNQKTLVFGRFYQAENNPQSRNCGGIGLGLYTSKTIIEAHGGRIWVESSEGEGSTFCFTLPF